MKNIEGGVESEKKDFTWKNWTVGVFSASSELNINAKNNSREVGKMLAENGYDAVNGGYGVGGMGGMRDGFVEACREKGMTDEEIEKHLKGVIYSEDVIGKTLAESRKINSPATITKAESLAERAGGLIQQSNAVIATEGGIGTAIEALLSAQDQWFRELNTDKPNSPRPLILLESTNMIERVVEMCEKISPKTINTLTSQIYVLAGHNSPENPSEMATLANDERMKKQLDMLLEFLYLESLYTEKTAEENDRQAVLAESLFSDSTEFHVMTLKEKLESKNLMSEGAGI